jgi:hypothetical protein
MKVTLRISVLSLAIVFAGAGAQSSGGPYRIEPSVVAGGGGTASGGAFQLSGTFGQSENTTLSASSYEFYGGFWSPISNVPADRVFANGFEP